MEPIQDDRMKPGDRRIWQPALKMDPDTGKLVELIRPMVNAYANRWKAEVIETKRVVDVYEDELR